MVEFDIILGMDWLSLYHARMDYYAKEVILTMPNKEAIEFKRERNGVCNGLISIMTAGKFIRKGCEVFLAYVKDTHKKEEKLTGIPVI
jgi:hypothetical protein